MKRMVIFMDFFGVICSEIAPIWLEKYLDKKTASTVRADIFPLADKGLLSEEDIYLRLSQITGVSAETVANEWQALIHINNEMVEAISSLKKNYDVYLLSNAVSSFLTNIINNNNLRCLFRKIYISSDISRSKPSDNFYLFVLNDLGIKADEAIMVDDNLDNIKGAQAVGINGILFTSAKELIRKLSSFGITIEK